MDDTNNFFSEEMHKKMKKNFLKRKEFLENNPEESRKFTIRKGKSDNDSVEKFIIDNEFDPNVIDGFVYEYNSALDQISVFPNGYSQFYEKIELNENISLIFDENLKFGSLVILNSSKIFKNLNKEDLNNGLNFFSMDLEVNNKFIKVDIIFKFKNQKKIEEFKLNPQTNNTQHIPKMNLEMVNA